MASYIEVQMYNFLSSKTKRGLRDKMFRHQVQTGRQFNYQIEWSDNEWVAWYYGTAQVELTEDKVTSKRVVVNAKELLDD